MDQRELLKQKKQRVAEINWLAAGGGTNLTPEDIDALVEEREELEKEIKKLQAITGEKDP